ncbi:hypothetical protein AOLI_G00183750 [Acnodon oligacanthus]
MADQELKVVCTEEEEKQRGRRVEEEETQEECSATEAETQGTHALTDQQEPPKDEECLACQSVSVPTETSEHQLLSDQKAQPAVELLTPKQTLDCLLESSSRLGVLGEDQNGKNKCQGHGGKDDGSDSVELNQDQEHNDLEAVGRDQEPEQKQRNQETPKNTAHSENIENQVRQTPDQHDQEGAVPVVMVTNLEKAQASGERQAEDSAESEKQEDTVPADANPAASPSDVTDFSGCDLQSLKSDTLSLLSETAISGKSDEHESLEEDTRSVAASSVMEGPEEDTRSVTASSVMSLFQRMQMDPLEREWLRCAALGNAPGLRQLLLQDPTLAPKKTALHWAAKQGRIETVDMMVRSGADVNQRAGYTPLHLASLHGHAHIIQLLIHNYNAKVNIRDYHGKMPCHYWNGSMDVFNTAVSQSGGKWSRGRRGQRYGQLSALLSRSRSQGSLSIELEPGSLELTPRLLPRSEANIQTYMDTF